MLIHLSSPVPLNSYVRHVVVENKSLHTILLTHTSLESSLFISSSKYESGRTSCRLALNARRCTLVRSLPLMSLSLSSGRYITSHVYYLGSITCPVWVKRRQGLLPVYLMHITCPFHYIMHAMLTSSSLKLSSLCRIHDLYIFLTPSEHIYKNSTHVQEHQCFPLLCVIFYVNNKTS